MGQEEVYNVLKKEGRWMTEKEIIAILKVAKVNAPLNALLKHHEVCRKECHDNGTFYCIWKAN